jgi:hypothetical protein
MFVVRKYIPVREMLAYSLMSAGLMFYNFGWLDARWL